MALSNIELRPYDQLACSIADGLNVGELVDRYGLPEAEADLLTLLQSAASKNLIANFDSQQGSAVA